MTAKTYILPVRQPTRMARWGRRLAGLALMLILVSAVAHRYQFLATPDLLRVLAVDVVLAVLALVLAGVAFARFWNDGDPVGRDILVAVLLALIALSPAIYAVTLAAMRPMLNDIATDTADPPQLRLAAQNRTPDMNPVVPISAANAALQAQAYPSILGRRYALEFDQARSAVNEAIKSAGWTAQPAYETGAGEVTIEATARTPLWGFPYDVAVRITDEGGTVFIDMRSASRYGHHDLGDNAARIISFYQLLDEKARERL